MSLIKNTVNYCRIFKSNDFEYFHFDYYLLLFYWIEFHVCNYWFRSSIYYFYVAFWNLCWGDTIHEKKSPPPYQYLTLPMSSCDFVQLWLHPSVTSTFLNTRFSPGDVGREERHGRAVCHQDPEEGHHHPGRRRGVHHGGEAGAGAVQQTPLPGAAALLLPNYGTFAFLLSQYYYL